MLISRSDISDMKKKILILLIVFTLLFIWGNSVFDKEHSSWESNFVLELLTPVLEIFLGKGNVTEHFVRKLAHFSEFFALGAELLWFFSLTRNGKEQPSFRSALLALSHAVLSALTDETIQIFSGRGSAIPDIWLDIAGAASGILIAYLALLIILKQSAKEF